MNGQPVVIADINDIAELPVPIEHDGLRYYLSRDEAGEWVLLASICPHQGGVVSWQDGEFVCKNHGWRFDAAGHSQNVCQQTLNQYPVQERDGKLVAQLDRSLESNRFVSSQHADVDVSIRLLAHSCLEIRHGDFTLLTDPWLFGPAFMGAWTQYPVAPISDDSLHPDVIWISHEHSDHFHEHSLLHFPKSTPIYFPDFPNRRIERKLRELGFTSIHPLKFGHEYSIGYDCRITVFEPAGLWNDSIALFDVAGFRVLNVNDAGINHRIAPLVAPVDVVASGFSPGASAYPLRWTNKDPGYVREYYDKLAPGLIDMLHTACRIYRPRYLLPYASHFELWHPEHRQYRKLIRKNRVYDISDAFSDSDVDVLDILPGEAWHAQTGTFSRRWRDPKALYAEATIDRHLDKAFEQQTFQRFYPASMSIDDEEVHDYFLALNRVPDLIFCEALTIRLDILNPKRPSKRTVYMRIEEGKLEILKAVAGPVDKTISVPEQVLANVIHNDLSWDEAHIGFWCTVERDPDVYHAGFWRLLQAPYFRRPAALSPSKDTRAICPDTGIAELLRVHGADAERILRRYGLYCGACARATAENLEHAAAFHGLSANQKDKLLTELNAALIA